MGSVVIPHLNSGWHVDQAILSEEERLVVIRFGTFTLPLLLRTCIADIVRRPRLGP